MTTNITDKVIVKRKTIFYVLKPDYFLTMSY